MTRSKTTSMTRSKTTSILVVLVVVAFVAVVIASSLGQSGSGTHVMPNGQTMDSSAMPE